MDQAKLEYRFVVFMLGAGLGCLGLLVTALWQPELGRKPSDNLALNTVSNESPSVVPVELDVFPVTGSAPLTVTITRPDALIQRVEMFQEQRNGCETAWSFGTHGFEIDWGDDLNPGDDPSATQPLGHDGCPELLSHTYTTPGDFTIKALLFHTGPVDETIAEWKSEKLISLSDDVQ